MTEKLIKPYPVCKVQVIVVDNKKKVFCAVFLLILAALAALPSFALRSYNDTGTEDGSFYTGQGIFNDNNPQLSVTTASKSLTGIKGVPLVADLDNDGTNEIILIDSTNLRMYHDASLDVVDALSLPADERASNLLAYDIDADGRAEVIFFMEQSGILQIIDWNGSSLTNQSSVKMPTDNDFAGGEAVIECGAADSCLIAYTDGVSSASPTGYNLSVAVFDSTAIYNSISLVSVTTGGKQQCFPKVRNMEYVNLDGVGGDEYVFNTMEFISGSDDIMYFWSISVSGTTPTLADSYNTDNFGLGHGDFNLWSVGDVHCVDSNLGRYFTPLVVHDFDGASGNGLEVAVGSMVDEDEFIMGLFESDFDFIDDFPESFEADGVIVSNVMLSNIFSDTGLNDFCVMGQQDVNQELDLLCGTYSTGDLFETYEFKASTSGDFNVTKDYGFLGILSHAGQYSDTQVLEGNDATEVLSAYGVYRIDDTTYNGSLFVLSMENIFDLPVDDVACIAADVEQAGSNDLLCHTGTTLYYIDDGLQNQPATVSSVSYNPCVKEGAVIKLNETLQITVTAEDGNSEVLGLDKVSINVTLYTGTPDEVTQQQTGITSGQAIPFAFTLNQTGTETITIRAWDTENPTEVDILAQSFTVADNGIGFGDSTCTDSFVAMVTATTPANESLTPAAENPVKGGLTEINALFPIGLTTLWLLIIVILDVLMIVEARHFFKGWDARYVWAVIAIVDVVLIVVGAIFAVVSLWLIFLLILMMITVGVLWGVRTLQGGG